MTPLALEWTGWLQLFGYYLGLSLLSVGGAISTAPDMHRILVSEHGWISDPQFAASIALAQAAPGPNVLFIALLGWNVGLNAAAGAGAGSGATWGWALAGAAVCMLGIMLPSTTLTLLATRWAHRNRQRRAVRAFRLGLAPIVVGLVAATAWVLGRAHGVAASDWPLWLLSLACGLLVWRTRLHLLWLLGAGAALGAAGWV
ncbi:MAG: chromate transporter [Simplicispira sp.]|nr:chromate transporter [Simplicispira sp.]